MHTGIATSFYYVPLQFSLGEKLNIILQYYDIIKCSGLDEGGHTNENKNLGRWANRRIGHCAGWSAFPRGYRRAQSRWGTLKLRKTARIGFGTRPLAGCNTARRYRLVVRDPALVSVSCEIVLNLAPAPSWVYMGHLLRLNVHIDPWIYAFYLQKVSHLHPRRCKWKI